MRVPLITFIVLLFSSRTFTVDLALNNTFFFSHSSAVSLFDEASTAGRFTTSKFSHIFWTLFFRKSVQVNCPCICVVIRECVRHAQTGTPWFYPRLTHSPICCKHERSSQWRRRDVGYPHLRRSSLTLATTHYESLLCVRSLSV